MLLQVASAVIFYGCAQSANACVTASFLPHQDPTFEDWVLDYQVNSTFGPDGGWLFQWAARDSLFPSDVAFVDYQGTLYANGLGSPLNAVGFTDSYFGLPDGWTPDQFSVSLVSGSNPTQAEVITLRPQSVPTTVTPEPSTATLVGTSLLALGLLGFRRPKTSTA